MAEYNLTPEQEHVLEQLGPGWKVYDKGLSQIRVSGPSGQKINILAGV